MAIRRVLTYQDYEALPNDGRRYEILDGELSVTAAPAPSHQDVVGNLYLILRGHVDARRLGKVYVSPIDCILADTTIVQPDLVYLDPSRLRLVSRRGIEGAPTALIEVLSPSTTRNDRGPKFQLYARYEVPYHWVVDPDARTVEAYELDAAGSYRLAVRAGRDAAVAVPPFVELALSPDALWASPLP